MNKKNVVQFCFGIYEKPIYLYVILFTLVIFHIPVRIYNDRVDY